MWGLFLVLLISMSAMSLIQWRLTLPAVLIIGFTQDIFRKLIVGEPRIFVVMVGIVFACGLLSLLRNKGINSLSEPFFKWSSDLREPLTLLLLVLVAQFLHSYFRFGNPVVSLIGLLSYSAPFMAVVLGYFWASSLDQVRQFFKMYVCAGLIVALSLGLSFQGLDWTIFNEVGAGIKIYDMGTILFSHAGILRTGEIAAWHVATTACLIMVLFFTAKRRGSSTIMAIFLIALMLAVLVTGRRKMFMLFSLFVIFYILGVIYYRRVISSGYIITGGFIVLTGWMMIEVIFTGGYGESINNYISRGTNVYGDATDRFINLGLNPIQWAYNRVGLLGGGLGIASQGASYFGASNIAGGSGEGGLGKIMVELGLPGLLAMLWLGISGLVYVRKILKLAAMQSHEPRWLLFSLGLVIFIFVNVLTFSVATQLYGDMFILIMLGITAGFLLAVPRMIAISLTSSEVQGSD
jgi:hypothetical protein